MFSNPLRKLEQLQAVLYRATIVLTKSQQLRAQFERFAEFLDSQIRTGENVEEHNRKLENLRANFEDIELSYQPMPLQYWDEGKDIDCIPPEPFDTKFLKLWSYPEGEQKSRYIRSEKLEDVVYVLQHLNEKQREVYEKQREVWMLTDSSEEMWSEEFHFELIENTLPPTLSDLCVTAQTQGQKYLMITDITRFGKNYLEIIESAYTKFLEYAFMECGHYTEIGTPNFDFEPTKLEQYVASQTDINDLSTFVLQFKYHSTRIPDKKNPFVRVHDENNEFKKLEFVCPKNNGEITKFLEGAASIALFPVYNALSQGDKQIIIVTLTKAGYASFEEDVIRLQENEEMTPRMMDVLIAIKQGDVNQSQFLKIDVPFRILWQGMEIERRRKINEYLSSISYLKFGRYIRDTTGAISLDSKLTDLLHAIKNDTLSSSKVVQEFESRQKAAAEEAYEADRKRAVLEKKNQETKFRIFNSRLNCEDLEIFTDKDLELEPSLSSFISQLKMYDEFPKIAFKLSNEDQTIILVTTAYDDISIGETADDDITIEKTADGDINIRINVTRQAIRNDIRKSWQYILFIKDGTNIETFVVYRPNIEQIQKVFSKFDSNHKRHYTFEQILGNVRAFSETLEKINLRLHSSDSGM